MTTDSIDGRTILLLEDDYLVGLALRAMLDQLGATVIGPMPTVDAALRVVNDGQIDGAVLDINIRGLSSEPVGRALLERDIPFCFVTGFRSPMLLSHEMRAHPRLSKPVSAPHLRSLMQTLMA